MDITTFRSYVRSLLAEPQASYWTDAEIDTYLEVALINITGRFWSLLVPVYSIVTYLSTTANSPYISLPEDCSRVVYLKVASDPGKIFPYIPDNMLDYYEENSLEGWRFEGGQIRIYPAPTESKQNYFKLKYLPKFQDLEDVPEELHPLLAVEVVIQAKVKDENIPQYLLVLQKQFYDDAVRNLTKKQLQNEEIMD